MSWFYRDMDIIIARPQQTQEIEAPMTEQGVDLLLPRCRNHQEVKKTAEEASDFKSSTFKSSPYRTYCGGNPK